MGGLLDLQLALEPLGQTLEVDLFHRAVALACRDQGVLEEVVFPEADSAGDLDLGLLLGGCVDLGVDLFSHKEFVGVLGL